MNYNQQQNYWKQYVREHGGNVFESIVDISKETRDYESLIKHVILSSKALDCILTNKPPKDLSERLKRYKDRETIRRRLFYDDLVEIDDLCIRDAVEASCRLSLISKHLNYDYKDITDLGQQTRVRILTRLILKELEFKEDHTMGNTEKLITPTLDVAPITTEATEPVKKRRGRKPKAVKEAEEAAKKAEDNTKEAKEKPSQTTKKETKVSSEEDNKNGSTSEKTKDKTATKPKKTISSDETSKDTTSTGSKTEAKVEPKKEEPKKEVKKEEPKKDEPKLKVVEKAPVSASSRPTDTKKHKLGDRILIKTPLTVYRAPNKNTPTKAYQGYAILLSDLDDEFVKVSVSRPGMGEQIGYMLIPEQIKKTL